MALRKANSYSKKRVVPYTRVSKKRQKSFIKAVPNQKIVKFVMGNARAYKNGKLPHVIKVVSNEKAQIRHNALEASRQFLNKKLERQLNKNYMFQVVPFPHHVQRENKMLTGAGADRMQTGMQLAFGKPVGKAALLEKGSPIFTVATGNIQGIRFARNLLKRVTPKLPCKVRIEYHKEEKE